MKKVEWTSCANFGFCFFAIGQGDFPKWTANFGRPMRTLRIGGYLLFAMFGYTAVRAEPSFFSKFRKYQNFGPIIRFLDFSLTNSLVPCEGSFVHHTVATSPFAKPEVTCRAAALTLRFRVLKNTKKYYTNDWNNICDRSDVRFSQFIQKCCFISRPTSI